MRQPEGEGVRLHYVMRVETRLRGALTPLAILLLTAEARVDLVAILFLQSISRNMALMLRVSS